MVCSAVGSRGEDGEVNIEGAGYDVAAGRASVRFAVISVDNHPYEYKYLFPDAHLGPWPVAHNCTASTGADCPHIFSLCVVMISLTIYS